MLCSLEKYCCAVVLHSRLSIRKLSRTLKEKTVSICLKDAGKRPVLRSCSCIGFASEQAQKRTSISKTPAESTTVKRVFPEAPVRVLRELEYPESKHSSKRSKSESEMVGTVGRASSGCGVSLGVGRGLESSAICASGRGFMILYKSFLVDVALAACAPYTIQEINYIII